MSSANPTPASDAPKYIGVECRVCGTLMYGRSEHVGKKLKCPDCGARTVLPPAPPAKPKKIPAAMEGEQYELWDADEQPLPSELRARQPKYIALHCSRCDSLLYATESQAGQTIACPDCGRKNVVPAPARPVVKPSVLAQHADAPVLDPAAAPGERPVHRPVTTRGMTFEEEQDAAYAQAREKSKRTGKAMEIDVRGRPVMPRWPLLTSILPFPFYTGCLERWGALTLGFILALFLILNGVPAWLNWAGDSPGAMEAIGGLAQTMIGAICAILWLAAASNVVIAIVSQSAVGNDRIAEWPPMNFIASMGEMLPVTIAAIFTAAPGWMLGNFVAGEAGQLAILAGGSLLAGFPLALLSQLAGNSTWNLIDLGVLGALVRRPISLMLFYVESAVLATLCAAATIAAVEVDPYLPLALAPLYVGCLFVYARLLGRLGWVISEAMPGEFESP